MTDVNKLVQDLAEVTHSIGNIMILAHEWWIAWKDAQDYYNFDGDRVVSYYIELLNAQQSAHDKLTAAIIEHNSSLNQDVFFERCISVDKVTTSLINNSETVDDLPLYF